MGEITTTTELMRWHLAVGVDETIGETPFNRFVAAPPPRAAAPPEPREIPQATPPLTPQPTVARMPVARTPVPVVAESLLRGAWALAEAAETVDQLHLAVAGFDGCGLKETATNTVFGDGDPRARIVFIGEGPGAEEDRQGLPFVGPSGRLLDKMLESIGLERGSVYISNTVFWRPPGNRTPTVAETALCLPFVERLMELIDPDILVTLGGPAAKAMLAETSGIGRLRGKWYTYSTPRLSRPIPATALFHPAYLLRTPTRKRETWADLLAVRDKLLANDTGEQP